MIAAMDGIVKSEVEKSNEEDVDSLWTPVGLPKQSKVVCVGRICNEVRYVYFINFVCVFYGIFCILYSAACYRLVLLRLGIRNGPSYLKRISYTHSHAPCTKIYLNRLTRDDLTVPQSVSRDHVKTPQDHASRSIYKNSTNPTNRDRNNPTPSSRDKLLPWRVLIPPDGQCKPPDSLRVPHHHRKHCRLVN